MIENDGEGERSRYYRPKPWNSAAEASAAMAAVVATGAGDSFNAGYLAARLAGPMVEDSARQAHRLAGTLIRHPDAILPPAVSLPELSAA